jgi:hypothetical protein
MNTTFKRAWHRWFGVAALAVVSGTAGWALGQHRLDGRGPATAHMATVHMIDPHVTTVPRSPQARGSGAAGQAFPSETRTVDTDDTVVASESSCEVAAEDTSVVVDMELLERTLTEATESERHTALTDALEAAGGDLPTELLRRIYESDPSESVRLLAFTTYVDSVSDDRTEVRAALQSGLYDGSSAVQVEAQRRLAELEQYERALSEIPPQG